MTGAWSLPRQAAIGEAVYHLHTDWRDILEIIAWLGREDLPLHLRWEIALGLFYEEPLPPRSHREGVEYLCRFLRGGSGEDTGSGRKLLDWEQDAAMIVADVNAVAGQEIRALPELHWWTFLSWFHGIREGQLSTVVAIRDKLARGKKLQEWEQDFYRDNKARVDLPKRYTPEELAEKQRLEALLGK